MPLSHDAEDHSHIFDQIDGMSICYPDKMKLQAAADVSANISIEDHLVIIDSCIDYEGLYDNLNGVLQLLNYRREVMEAGGSSADELAEVAVRIQDCALRRYVASKPAKKPFVAVVPAEKRRVSTGGRRRSRS